MKNLLVHTAAFAATTVLSSAATFFFSFDTTQAGTGSVTSSVTANSGFQGTPTIAKAGTQLPTDGQGGEDTFTDFQGNTWLGSDNNGTPGHSAVWNPNGTGNSFSTTFSTVGLTDVSLRFSIRSAGTNALSSFTSFTYDIGSGPVSTGGSTSFPATSIFSEYTADLTSLDSIEGQSSVTLTWSFADLGSGRSFRIDNLQVSAVPEPSVALCGLVGTLLLLRRQRNG